MHKILAISGGIDSIVLLHLFRDDPDAIVAHFNHGTRPSAADDEAFVRRLAAEYGKSFYSGQFQTTPQHLSEATARQARYQFLFQVASKFDGLVYTAHHLDDLAESIAINFTRGTGWRGLCALGNPLVLHPFLQPEIMPGAPWDRKRIYKYAARHSLTHRQDPTNNEDLYLRNRLRPAVRQVASLQLYELWRRQNNLRHEINVTLGEILPANLTLPRQPFATLPDNVATEILAALLANHHISATRPQLADFLNAVRTYRPGKKFNLPHDNFALIGRDTIKVL